MEALAVALVTTFGAIFIALIEKGRRENKSDHSALAEKVKETQESLSEKIELIGKSLGISIDRVEKAVERTESKVDEHIADHARGEFADG